MLEAIEKGREQLINDEINRILSSDDARKTKAEELAPWVLKTMTLEEYYQSEARRIATRKIDNILQENERIKKMELHNTEIEKRKIKEFLSGRHIGCVQPQKGEEHYIVIKSQKIQPKVNASMLRNQLGVENAEGLTIEFYVKPAGYAFRCIDIVAI